jgi:hypothetical protein
MDAGPRFAIVIVAAFLGGCAVVPMPEPGLAPGVERISFEPQPAPFCGRCENTKLIVTRDGQLLVEVGHWGGNYRNWQRQRTVRRITSAQFANFKQALEAYKPKEDVLRVDESCANYTHDQDGLRVEWAKGEDRRVRVFDFGCLDDRAMNEVVRASPEALGL